MFLNILTLVNIHFLSFSLESSPITDSDTTKRTVFQRSYSVVASEYDKQHSPSPARVKAVPRRRVHSGDAGNPSEKRLTTLKDKWCRISYTCLLCASYRSRVFPATTPLSWAVQADLSPWLPQQGGKELPMACPGFCNPAPRPGGPGSGHEACTKEVCLQSVCNGGIAAVIVAIYATVSWLDLYNFQSRIICVIIVTFFLVSLRHSTGCCAMWSRPPLFMTSCGIL